MKMIREINDVSKEVLTILSYFDNRLLQKIPFNVLNKLKELAADSKLDFYINIEKDLEKQEISEESKDLISLIYYIYIADKTEKNNLLKLWKENENKYQDILREKYSIDSILENRKKLELSEEKSTNKSVDIVEYKESIFKKIINKIRSMFIIH